jgi:acyl-CoA thioesterase I
LEALLMRRVLVKRSGVSAVVVVLVALGGLAATARLLATMQPAPADPAAQPAGTQPAVVQPVTSQPATTQPAGPPPTTQPTTAPTTQATTAPAPGTGAAADPRTYLADVVNLLEAQWPKNRMVTVICHGHSVPAGYFKTPVVDTFNAYPHLLHRLLKDRFQFAVINVIVTAIGGENAEGGAARFERDVLSLRPDVVTIDYALNDRAIGLEKAKVAWSSMIEKAQAAGVKVILMTPTPDTRAKLDSPDDPINQHAEQIRQLARHYKVGLCDSQVAIRKRVEAGAKLENLMSQVNHPNRNGHDTVAKELFQWFPSSTARGS